MAWEPWKVSNSEEVARGQVHSPRTFLGKRRGLVARSADHPLPQSLFPAHSGRKTGPAP